MRAACDLGRRLVKEWSSLVDANKSCIVISAAQPWGHACVVRRFVARCFIYASRVCLHRHVHRDGVGDADDAGRESINKVVGRRLNAASRFVESQECSSELKCIGQVRLPRLRLARTRVPF